MFELDGHTGWIKVVSSLDRDAEDVKKTGGVYTMVVRVSWFSITLRPEFFFISCFTNPPTVIFRKVEKKIKFNF